VGRARGRCGSDKGGKKREGFRVWVKGMEVGKRGKGS
jgi:hypothetical protein